MPVLALTLILVAGGATDYEIVVGERTTKPALTAAHELQDWIEAATSVQIPMTERPHADRKHLFVGPTEVPADWGISPEDIAPEGFVIKTVGEDMAFVGADRGSHPEKIAGTTAPTWCGTMNAVYDFLEEQVGVRWYWDDELGTIVPQLDELKVPALNYSETPDFIDRTLAYGPRNSEGQEAARYTWGRRNRLGKSISTYHSHAWFKALPIEEYGETHPEYYALVNGERVTRYYMGHHGGQVCTSNPEVIEIFAEYCKQYFRDHPDRTMVSVSPNDGGGFCQCDNCTALDVKMWPEDSSRAGHPEMADRMITFYNAIAEKVVKEFPDRYLGAYVYSYYQKPPYRVKPHPNLALVLAPNTAWAGSVEANWERDSKQMADWAAIHKNMFMYDIFYRSTRAQGHIAPVVDHTVRYLRYMKQIGMQGGYLYIGPTWESLGPGAYLMAKLMWDTDADEDAMLARYYDDLYGPAAGKVRELFELIEKSWIAAVGREGPPELPQAAYFVEKGGASEALGVLVDCWEPILPQALALVGEAADAAQTDEQRARVARVADQIEFTRASVEALMGIADFETTRSPDPAIAGRVRAGIEAREAALKLIGETWSPHFRDWVRGADDNVQSPLRPSAAYFTLASGPAPSGENLLREWDAEKLTVGEDVTKTLRVAGEGDYSVEVVDDRVYEGAHALKITVGADSHASINYDVSANAESGYRFAMRYYADPLLPATVGKTAETPVTRVIFRDSKGKAVSETKLYSWEKASAEVAEGKWADHLHVFRTLPGTERITVTVFFFRPGTWWVDDVSLTEL